MCTSDHKHHFLNHGLFGVGFSGAFNFFSLLDDEREREREGFQNLGSSYAEFGCILNHKTFEHFD
jgi:hypothetical protein